MLTERTYRTEISASFELSRVYTALVARLRRMIVISNDFLKFGVWAFLLLYPTVHACGPAILLSPTALAIVACSACQKVLDARSGQTPAGHPNTTKGVFLKLDISTTTLSNFVKFYV